MEGREVGMQRRSPAARRVQVVYYICRMNGQMEHPHFLELQQHHNQPIRLRDVVERLTLLRGKGMPSLFAWSCKRRYKNGYVWNDLAENDVIYPADGAEYVLKGSEIITAEHVAFSRRASAPMVDLDEDDSNIVGYKYNAGGAVRRAAALTTAAHHAAAELVNIRKQRSHPIPMDQLALEDASPPSSTSSVDKAVVLRSDQPDCGDPAEPLARAGSLLLHLISCGATAAPPRGRPEAGAAGRSAAEDYSGSIVEERSTSFDEKRSPAPAPAAAAGEGSLKCIPVPGGGGRKNRSSSISTVTAAALQEDTGPMNA